MSIIKFSLLLFIYFILHHQISFIYGLEETVYKNSSEKYDEIIKSNPDKVIRKYPEGIINWTDGIVYTFTDSNNINLNQRINILNVLKDNFYNAYFLLDEHLLKKARDNLLGLLFKIFLEEDLSLKDFYKSFRYQPKLVNHVIQNVTQYPIRYINLKNFEKSLKYPIYGNNSLSQFIISEDTYIKEEVKIQEFDNERDFEENKNYSSLIIDLRRDYHPSTLTSYKINLPPSFQIPKEIREKVSFNHLTSLLEIHSELSEYEINLLKNIRPKDPYYHFILDKMIIIIKNKPKKITFNPTLFPKIYTSDRILLYSKNQVPFHLRSKNINFANYIKQIKTFYDFEKVGQNPYFIIANYIEGKNHSNIVLNKILASPFFSNPNNIQRLYEGKLFLLLNE